MHVLALGFLQVSGQTSPAPCIATDIMSSSRLPLSVQSERRRAWLNPQDKHKTTGRINLVAATKRTFQSRAARPAAWETTSRAARVGFLLHFSWTGGAAARSSNPPERHRQTPACWAPKGHRTRAARKQYRSTIQDTHGKPFCGHLTRRPGPGFTRIYRRGAGADRIALLETAGLRQITNQSNLRSTTPTY